MTYPPGPGQPGPGQPYPTPGLPAGAPAPPPAPPLGPPPAPPHRSYTKVVVGGAVVMVVLLVVVGLVGGGLYRNRGKLFDSKPTQFQSASSGQPIYHKLPGCDAMPTTTLAKLVPAMQTTLTTRVDPQDSSDGPYGVCQWDNLESDNKPPDEDRSVKVTMTGYADYVTAGVDAAKKDLTEALSTADGLVGKTDGDHRYGSVHQLPGLGPGAFTQDYTVQSSTWTYGGTDVRLRVDNVFVELDFIGDDGPDGKEKPMPAAQALAGAASVGKEVIGWLSSCAACKS